jgi:predicted DNA-binding transcriptional regulator YafY
MAKSNNQKGKILYLERLLCDTGEDHIVTMQEILTFLLEKGISAERKSIYDDLEVLRTFGMDIRYRRGRPGGYYLARSGTDEELCRIEPELFFGSLQTGMGQMRQVRLKCSDSALPVLKKCFPYDTQVGDQTEDEYSFMLQVSDLHLFYGWLTAMGPDVLLLKPKKMVQDYRDYLKLLARQYKDISKS